MANFFQQLTDEFFSIASPPTLAAYEFCTDCVGKRPYVRYRAARVYKSFPQDRILFFILEKNLRFVYAVQQRQTARLYCFLLLSTGAKLFASQYLWLATPWP